jgi:hypothetical protein
MFEANHCVDPMLSGFEAVAQLDQRLTQAVSASRTRPSQFPPDMGYLRSG